MRGKEKCLLFMMGPKDKKYSHASHTHLDMLSVVLAAYGTYFLVDPGTYTYYGDFKWRNYFRNIKAHNTVIIDDNDPVKMEEIFEFDSIPIVEIKNYSASNKFDFIIAKHQGYKSLCHTRSIVFIKQEYWVIMDLIEGQGEHIYDLYFHLNYDLVLEFNKENLGTFISNKKGVLQIFPLFTNGLNADILDGEISNKYNVKLNAPILKFSKRGRPPLIFITVLYPFQQKDCIEKCNKILNILKLDSFEKWDKKIIENESIGIKIEFLNFFDNILFFNYSNKSQKQEITFFRQPKNSPK